MIKGVLLDVYRTMLEVGPPPPDAARRWQALLAGFFPKARALSLDALSIRCRQLVEEDHAAAKSNGVKFPEVQWTSIVARAMEVSPDASFGDFVFAHAQLQRTIRLANGVADFLGICREQHVPCGIVSNAQAYTLRELDAALGLDHRKIFEPDLLFWSFQNGFSKPDPHVFRLLAARWAQRGISPAEVVMIGDRPDNDVEPAARAGFQTWRYGGGVSWDELSNRLRAGRQTPV